MMDDDDDESASKMTVFWCVASCIILETYRRFRTPKNGFCSYHTKYDRTSISRRKLFVSERRLRKKKRHTIEECPGFESWRGNCICLQNEVEWKTVARQNSFVSQTRLQELRSQTRKLPWVRVLVKILASEIYLSIIFNDTWPAVFGTD